MGHANLQAAPLGRKPFAVGRQIANKGLREGRGIDRRLKIADLWIPSGPNNVCHRGDSPTQTKSQQMERRL
jgi:hypothetical protein